MDVKSINGISVVNLSQFDMEDDVESAFNIALELSEGQPVNASHLLRATTLTRSSLAFIEIAELLKLSPEESDIAESKSMGDLKEFPVVSSLLNSLFIADPFITGKRIWGRDFITLAILANNDESLRSIAEEADSTLDELQDEWYHFVIAKDTHRKKESWTKWWHKAGVFTEEEKKIQGDYYLLTWDPARYDNISNLRANVFDKDFVVWPWNVGHRDVKIRDNIFLMRHGDDRPGLVGAGRVIGDPEEGPYWDESKKIKSVTIYADIVWSTLEEFPIIPLDDLIDITNEKELWTRKGSGHAIQQSIAETITEKWHQGSIKPLPWVDTDAIPPMGKSRYKISDHDSLKAITQAEMFASLLIAKNVNPPLALGLLGDWGVGKTFFMRLMQEKVSSVAGKNAKASAVADSIARVAQIEFNAWHYVDSDLWASMASHIFNSLAEELRGPNDNVDEIRRELRNKIDSSTREKEEAEAVITVAKDERIKASAMLVSKQEERKRVAAELEKKYLQRVWEAVLKVRPSSEIEEQSDWPDLPALKTKAEETAKRLGITELIDTGEEAVRVFNVFKQLMNRGSGILTIFRATFTGEKAWLAYIIVFGLIALFLGWPWIQVATATLLELTESSLVNFVSHLLRIGTVVGATLSWIATHQKKISSTFGYLEKINDEMNKPRIELSNPSAEEKKWKKKIDVIDSEIANEESRIDEAERQITEAHAEIQRINSGGLVYDFLEGRVRDSHYLDRLGLISVIRQDFEKLGELLRDWRKHGASNKQQKKKSPEVIWDERPIERIILYIDDLDRCPPKRVVDVLQAVHLILAFDLFAVVVAVDARWLERSLNESYNPRNKLSGELQEEVVHQFSAQNYLEKIFQIPYYLSEMGEDGFKALVEVMVQKPRKEFERSLMSKVVPDTGHSSSNKSAQENGSGDKKQGAIELNGMNEQGNTGQQDIKKGDMKKEEEKQREQEQAAAMKRIEAMVLETWEEDYMKAHFPFIPTPRMAKRFVNIYRLLRVRAVDLYKDFSTFIQRDKGEYRAVITLLAIWIGHGQYGHEIFRDILDTKALKFQRWIKLKTKKLGEEAEELLNLPEKEQALSNKTVKELREVQAVGLQIISKLKKVDEKLKETNAPPFNDKLSHYKTWLDEVGRYSFRWNQEIDQ